MKNDRSPKLNLNKETIRSINVSSSIRTGRINNPTVTCHCGSLLVCNSNDACTASIDGPCHTL